MIRREFSPYVLGGRNPWDPPFPAIELNGMTPPEELIPYGRAKVAKIDNFPELKGRRGVLLKWSYLEKAKAKMIVELNDREGYTEGGDVQIIQLLDVFAKPRYYTRPMVNGVDQWQYSKLNPVTDKIIESLDRAYYFKIA